MSNERIFIMTNKKSTKKALITSALCLLLCVSMLVGATFAWFTDSVTSTNNIVTAGNLDENLYWSTDGNAWTPVDASTNVFKTGTLWEPGHTEVVYLKVVNEGTLALKYNLNVNIASETPGINVYDEPFMLSDYIKYDVIAVDKAFTNRDAAHAAPFNRNGDPGGFGVDGVFHQLLHDRSRPFHHFTGGDLIDSIGIQQINGAHGHASFTYDLRRIVLFQ
jgi:predicted ribosomally synthesized peptide with SipW-like signal peptide